MVAGRFSGPFFEGMFKEVSKKQKTVFEDVLKHFFDVCRKTNLGRNSF